MATLLLGRGDRNAHATLLETGEETDDAVVVERVAAAVAAYPLAGRVYSRKNGFA